MWGCCQLVNHITKLTQFDFVWVQLVCIKAYTYLLTKVLGLAKSTKSWKHDKLKFKYILKKCLHRISFWGKKKKILTHQIKSWVQVMVAVGHKNDC